MHEPSHAQKAYLARQKRDRCLVVGARLLVFLIFLAQWEIFSRLGWIDSFIFSSPSMIFQTFVKMAQDQSLFVHIGATLKETLLSFAFVVLAGLGISVLLWSCPRIAKVLEPYLVALNSLPKSALAPLLIVWLGARQRTIIVAGMSVAIFGCILNLCTGFGEVNPEKRKLIRTLGGGKKEELLKIVLPSCIPLILANMKVNIGLCLVGVIIGEFIGARQGLGYLIIYGSQTFQQVCILKLFRILFYTFHLSSCYFQLQLCSLFFPLLITNRFPIFLQKRKYFFQKQGVLFLPFQAVKRDSFISSFQVNDSAFLKAKFLQSPLHRLVVPVGVDAQIAASFHSKSKGGTGDAFGLSIRCYSVDYAVGLLAAVPCTVFNHAVSWILSHKKYEGAHDFAFFLAHVGNPLFYIIFYRRDLRVAVLPLVGVSVVFHKFSGDFI